MRLPQDPFELATILARRLDGAQGDQDTWDKYYAGSQSAAFLSPEALDALNGSITKLSLNMCRLAILSLVERLRILGFRIDGAAEIDRDVRESWERSGMDRGSDSAHVDSFVGRRSYVVAWVDDYGDPLISAESARQCTTINDAVTGKSIVGLKRYWDQIDPDQPVGTGHAVLFTADRVVTFSTDDDTPISGYPPMGGAWTIEESLPNPTGVCNVVSFVNGYGRRSLDQIEGESDLDDLTSPQDALNKVIMDSLVTSEAFARPRRWATGLEIQYKKDPDTGQDVIDAETGLPVPVNPFSKDSLRVWQAEDPAVKFGQFAQADLSPYSSLASSLREAVSAVSTLPGHYLGIAADQPPSAEGIRAAEASLVSRAIGKIRMTNPSWTRVAQLEVSLRTGRHPDSVKARPVWADPSTRTPTQEADVASKLGVLGVPLTNLLTEVLGWTPDQVESATGGGVT